MISLRCSCVVEVVLIKVRGIEESARVGDESDDALLLRELRAPFD